MSDIRRNYELAFHINPNMEEARIAAISNELKQKLVDGQAVITFAKEPERTRLSYEIVHHAQAYFGYIQFNTENAEAGLPLVEEYIKLNNDIVRSIILRLPSDSEKAKSMQQAVKARERMEKKAKAAVAPKSAPVKNEALDKELEDIIEKL